MNPTNTKKYTLLISLSIVLIVIIGATIYIPKSNWKNIFNLNKTATVYSTGVTCNGTATTSGDYTICTYTEAGTSTFDVTSGSGDVEVLVVAGGGGGGEEEAGGGGAGGLVSSSSYSVTSGHSYSIFVGAGGMGATTTQGRGNSGEDSVFGDITAIGGGGGGGYYSNSGGNGGSGGGGCGAPSAGDCAAGTGSQGNSGAIGAGDWRNGGGGGGAGFSGTPGTGSAPGNGGDGFYFSQFASVGGYPAGWFGGGGGGGGRDAPHSTGGQGGGGYGYAISDGDPVPVATDGVANTGGGGGGGSGWYGHGGNGGSGIVIIKYIDSVFSSQSSLSFSHSGRRRTNALSHQFSQNVGGDTDQSVIDTTNTQESQSPSTETSVLPTQVITPVTPPTPTFIRNLSLGSTGNDVKLLQIYLNNHGFTVSDTGPGSKGNETTYYGVKTQQAVREHQEYYKDQILTPFNLTIGTGYFGTTTRKFVNGNQ